MSRDIFFDKKSFARSKNNKDSEIINNIFIYQLSGCTNKTINIKIISKKKIMK